MELPLRNAVARSGNYSLRTAYSQVIARYEPSPEPLFCSMNFCHQRGASFNAMDGLSRLPFPGRIVLNSLGRGGMRGVVEGLCAPAGIFSPKSMSRRAWHTLRLADACVQFFGKARAKDGESCMRWVGTDVSSRKRAVPPPDRDTSTNAPRTETTRGNAAEVGRDSIWERLHKPVYAAWPGSWLPLVYRGTADQNGANTSRHRSIIFIASRTGAAE